MKLTHPKELYLLSLVEMWERFGYYGMRAMLVLFLVASIAQGGIGMTRENAVFIYGIFTGFVYFTPLLGGWLADRYLGQQKSIIIGAVTMMLGYFCLALAQGAPLVYLSMGIIVFGNGFFKPNISVLVGSLYDVNDARKDKAFTIFYMGINLGAFIAPLITGALAVKFGFAWGFAAAGFGMLCGLVLFAWIRRRFLGDIGRYPALKQEKAAGKVELSHEEKSRMNIIFIMMFFSIVFFAGFEQAGSSMTLYADQFVDRHVAGHLVPTEWFQAINPLFIILFAPLLSMFWQFLAGKKKEPSIPTKMGMGLILLSIGFVVLLAAEYLRGADMADTTLKTSAWVMVFAYGFHTLGELCLSPIGLSMVSRLSPVHLASMMMGIWTTNYFVSNLLAGALASVATKCSMYLVFLGLAIAAVFFGIILLFMNKWLLKKSYGYL